MTWEDDPDVTQFSFVSSGPYVTVTTLWGGVPYQLERQVNRVVEFDEDDQGTVVDRASIKPHLPPELIETLATPELRFQAEVANRAPLHPNEIDMLEAVVDAMSARIDAYLPASGVNQVLITEMMCNEFNAATEYFTMDSSSAPLGAAARDYLRFKLSRATGGVARWYAVLDMIRPGNWPDFAERLGITRGRAGPGRPAQRLPVQDAVAAAERQRREDQQRDARGGARRRRPRRCPRLRSWRCPHRRPARRDRDADRRELRADRGPVQEDRRPARPGLASGGERRPGHADQRVRVGRRPLLRRDRRRQPRRAVRHQPQLRPRLVRPRDRLRHLEAR